MLLKFAVKTCVACASEITSMKLILLFDAPAPLVTVRRPSLTVTIAERVNHFSPSTGVLSSTSTPSAAIL